MPDLTLPDQAGAAFRLEDELAQGAVVLAFYRGDW
jgi:peroxiredoxin